MKRKKTAQAKGFSFTGKDSDHSKISELDGTYLLSFAEKFELICELSLLHYQMKNNTKDLPRMDKTTAYIRKV